jgi:hypothetical protein
MKTFNSIFIIPTNCPYDMSMEFGWGEPGTVKQKTVEALIPDYLSKVETMIQPALWLSWTCAGCTKNSCPQRKCDLGGRALK